MPASDITEMSTTRGNRQLNGLRPAGAMLAKHLDRNHRIIDRGEDNRRHSNERNPRQSARLLVVGSGIGKATVRSGVSVVELV